MVFFTAVNIRKFVVRASRLSELVDLQSLTPSTALFLEASVRAGLNLLVSGGTQAGKTTMLNCLAAAIPGGERVISVEEVFEIRFPHPDWVALQTRQDGLEGTGEVRLRDLIKESLRMRPSRIIVGEVRAEEALDLLLALNSGLPGLCTIHANSAREALTKACMLPLLAGEVYACGLSVNLHIAHVVYRRRCGPSDTYRCSSPSEARSAHKSPAHLLISRTRTLDLRSRRARNLSGEVGS